MDDIAKLRNMSHELILMCLDKTKHISQRRKCEIYDQVLPILMDEISELYIFTERVLKTTDKKTWTKEEEEKLIELACDKKFSENNIRLSTGISILMGRSPESINTKLSQLVGKERLSKKVSGRFEGDFNGKETVGKVDGIVYKY